MFAGGYLGRVPQAGMGTRRWRSEGHRLRPTNRVCHPSSILHPRPILSIPSILLSKKFRSPLAFSKPGAILAPLEVYMVNSPSRPNVRPVAPPPLGRPVRHSSSLPHAGLRLRAGWGRPRHHFPGAFQISNLKFEIAPIPLCASAPLRLCVKDPSSSLNQGKNPSNQG